MNSKNFYAYTTAARTFITFCLATSLCMYGSGSNNEMADTPSLLSEKAAARISTLDNEKPPVKQPSHHVTQKNPTDIAHFVWLELVNDFWEHRKDKITGDAWLDASAIHALSVKEDNDVLERVAKKLAVQSFDLNSRNEEGETALHRCHPYNTAYGFSCCQHGHSQAKVLLLAGAKVVDDKGNGIKDSYGSTAFHRATRFYAHHDASRELFRLYIDKGANPYELNAPFKTMTLPDATQLPRSPFENMVIRNDFGSIAACLELKKYVGDDRPLALASSVFYQDPELSLIGHMFATGCLRTVETLMQGAHSIHFSIASIEAAIASFKETQKAKAYEKNTLLIGTIEHSLAFLETTMRTLQQASTVAPAEPSVSEDRVVTGSFSAMHDAPEAKMEDEDTSDE